MTWLQALWLGCVEGLTEFLPISSTGHLILASRAMGLSGEFSNAFNIAIQSGAIAAIVFLRRERFARLLPNAPSAPLEGMQGLMNLALMTVPALAVGFVLRHPIKEHLFHPGPVALAMAMGGVAILLLDRDKPAAKGLDQLTPKHALIIGLIQCLALWPGMSRSACTILAALGLGYGRVAATELSFIAAVPILLAATAYELLARPAVFAGQNGAFLVGLIAAFVSACLAVKGFLALLNRGGLKPFGWYRIIASPFFWLFFR